MATGGKDGGVGDMSHIRGDGSLTVLRVPSEERSLVPPPHNLSIFKEITLLRQTEAGEERRGASGRASLTWQGGQ